MKSRPLRTLVIASLLSDSKVFNKIGEPIKQLYVPYRKDKVYYLFNYLTDNKLDKSVNIDIESQEFIIHLTDELSHIVGEWHKDNKKKFDMELFIKYVDANVLITCINMFGIRQPKSIAIPTNIDEEYSVTLTYCLGKALNSNVDYSKTNKNIKINQIEKMFINLVFKTDTKTKESAELTLFLSDKERKFLTEVIQKVERRQGFNYA